MKNPNTKLVWSDDPRDQEILKPKTARSVTLDLSQTVAVFRIEKGGRGGKTVTVIDQLPRHETFLKELCKELKSACGSGGTFRLESTHGLIEIQGDKRSAIKGIFDKKGIRYKGM